ncbi:hypothetical protein GCM10020258_33830 [Sphingomonas yabuuchiae]
MQWAGGRTNGFDSAANAGLALRIPLLTGGLVSSRVRQAEAVRRAERFDADAVARGVVRAADSAWASLTAAQGRLTASAEGLKAADLALKGVRAEYGFGLRSTIDILVADQSYRAAQLAVARAQVDVLTAQAALLRATGRMGRGRLIEGVERVGLGETPYPPAPPACGRGVINIPPQPKTSPLPQASFRSVMPPA